MKIVGTSPLALSFEEALQPSRLLTQISVAAEHDARRELAQMGNAAFGVALAGAKFVMDSGSMQVVFEGGIPAGAKLMGSAGRLLPKLVDGRTGRIIKTARLASTGRTVASLTANSALLVVQAAHMISGHDNARRLRAVERGVDRLVHSHESELKSELEATYRHGKELLHGDLALLTEHDRREIHGLCRELFKLRAQWRYEFIRRLNGIEKAKAGWLRSLFTGKDEVLRKSRQSRAEEASRSLETIQLMHFSLLLQMALAGSAGKMEAFLASTLSDECKSWRALSQLAATRAEEIGGKVGAKEFQPFLQEIAQFVDFWSQEQWTKLTPADPAHSSSAKRRMSKQGREKTLPKLFSQPREGWLPETYATARGLQATDARDELRSLTAKGELTEVRRSGRIYYLAPA